MLIGSSTTLIALGSMANSSHTNWTTNNCAGPRTNNHDCRRSWFKTEEYSWKTTMNIKMQMYETEQLKHQEEERLGREKWECKLCLVDLNDFVRVDLVAANPLNVPYYNASSSVNIILSTVKTQRNSSPNLRCWFLLTLYGEVHCFLEIQRTLVSQWIITIGRSPHLSEIYWTHSTPK